jgi:DNA-binding NarL/FixJ family response regulator
VIQVWVVASSAALRAGLRLLLQEDERLEVIGESRTLAELEEAHPEVQMVLLADTFSTLAELQNLLSALKEPPALLWMADDLQSIPAFTRLPWRAWGIVSLEASGSELAAAVQALSEGLLAGSPTLLERAFGERAQHSSGAEVKNDGSDALTGREMEVLQSLAQGLANKQISLALGISEHTVKFHVSSIYAKLGVTNRTEAVRVGIQRGLVSV